MLKFWRSLLVVFWTVSPSVAFKGPRCFSLLCQELPSWDDLSRSAGEHLAPSAVRSAARPVAGRPKQTSLSGVEGWPSLSWISDILHIATKALFCEVGWRVEWRSQRPKPPTRFARACCAPRRCRRTVQEAESGFRDTESMPCGRQWMTTPKLTPLFMALHPPRFGCSETPRDDSLPSQVVNGPGSPQMSHTPLRLL